MKRVFIKHFYFIMVFLCVGIGAFIYMLVLLPDELITKNLQYASMALTIAMTTIASNSFEDKYRTMHIEDMEKEDHYMDIEDRLL